MSANGSSMLAKIGYSSLLIFVSVLGRILFVRYIKVESVGILDKEETVGASGMLLFGALMYTFMIPMLLFNFIKKRCKFPQEEQSESQNVSSKDMENPIQQTEIELDSISNCSNPPTKPSTVPFHVRLAFISFLQLFGICLSGLGILFAGMTIVTLLNGTGLIFISLLSAYITQTRVLYKTDWIAMGLIMLGCIIIVVKADMKQRFLANNSNGDAGNESNSNDDTPSNPLLGILVTIAGKLFESMSMIGENMLMQKPYHLKPIDISGYEGLYGAIISWTLVLTFHFLDAPPGIDKSMLSDNGRSLISIDDFFLKFIHNSTLGVYLLLVIVVHVFWYYVGNLVSIHVSDAARQVCAVLRCIPLWFIGVFVFQDETFLHTQPFEYLLFVAFGVIGAATVVFYEIGTPHWLRRNEPEDETNTEQTQDGKYHRFSHLSRRQSVVFEI